jgi:hypothetical protein
MFNALAYDEVTSCTMRLSFGRLTPATLRWSPSIPALSNFELSSSVQAFVRQRLLPVIQGVTTIDALLSLLAEDAEPCPWVASNGAIRAAQIVALAGLSGRNATEVRATLESRERLIARGFMKDSTMRDDPGTYIDRVLTDWAPRSSRSTKQI